ncbi:hypothetical protein C8Q79DRAFT_120329 [Trametes meyenii]|nr:hypothetical protein C8Q79DRAFT_120329 [Trametes meyenii]
MPFNVTVRNVVFTAVDDSETDLISYDDTWAHVTTGIDPDPDETYNQTGSIGRVHSSLTFNFQGIAIIAGATFPSPLPPNANQTLPNVTVTLDSNTPTRVSIASTPGDAFFSAVPLLPSVPHTLTITVDEATDAFPFILDALVYVPPQDLAQAQVAAPTPSPSPAGASSSSDDAQEARFNDILSQLLSARAAKNGPPVGAIVGGTIGGVVLLALLASAVWYFYVRPRRKGGRAFFYAPGKVSDMLADEYDLKPNPFPLDAAPAAPTRSLSFSSTSSRVNAEPLPAGERRTLAGNH